MFSLAQILTCALVAALASAVGLYLAARAARSPSWRATLPLAAVVGISVLLWRSAANVAALNDDPISWISPNDVLSPVVTYAALDLYASLTGMRARSDWARSRALLTLIAFAVNVLVI